MHSENEQRMRDLLQSGVLLMDELMHGHRETRLRCEAWTRDVASLGGRPGTFPASASERRRRLAVPFRHGGHGFTIALEPDATAAMLETQHGCPIGGGTWDGATLRLAGDVEPALLTAAREALAGALAGGDGEQ